jgi:rhodanese-related sulfurtransferase
MIANARSRKEAFVPEVSMTGTATVETPEAPELASVGFDELRRRVEDGDPDWVLVNVLPRAAFDLGRIPGSISLPFAEIAARAARALPSSGQETIVYCASSDCSLDTQAIALLRSLGYTRVREYPGGMQEWAERGGRIERTAVAPPAHLPVPAPRRLDRLRRTLRPLSPAAAFAWASAQPVWLLFGVWLSVTVIFALLYWLAGRVTTSLLSGGAPVVSDLPGLGTAFGFSLAIALSGGYGDVAAAGWMRLAVLAETATGLVLFGALVSKILGAQQEQLLSDVFRLTFENRLGRVRTNLHLVLAELGEIAGDRSDPAVPPRRLRARTEAVAMIFTGELQAVRDLVHGRPGGADAAALETLFACLAACLQELTELLTCVPSGKAPSGPLRRSLRRIGQLGADLCGTCPVQPLTPAVRSWMDRVHELCRALDDEPHPGQPAPPFALPGSDGRMHRLADHRDLRPVVLVWFPKAFTGG